MIPTPLVGIYRQYKQDTDSIASWLASTAKAYGYPANLLSASESGKKAPKAGKQNKGKQRGNKVVQHIIAIKDFLPLAEWIASRQDPIVTVPDAFSTTIGRLIQLRSEFGGKLADSGIERDVKSDRRHGYFIGVLEDVRDALRPRMAPTAAVVDTAIDASTQDLGNRFAGLTVDEPSQALLDAFLNAAHERPKPRADDPASYEAESQTSLEDIMFAFTMLINDVNRIRSHIEWIWSNQRDGMFDLGAAAVATNTAISLAHGLIEELSPLLDKQDGGAWGLVNKLFLMICLRKGYKPNQVYLETGSDNFNYDLYEEADQCYVNAFRLLISFREVLDPDHLPLIREGMFGKYDANSNRASKTGRQKQQEDQILLMEFFTELITVIRLIESYPVEDEFLRGMRVMEKTGAVSFSLVFAAQIFLDIHHIMRAGARQSFEVMQTEVGIMNNSIKLHFDFHKDLKISTWPASYDHGIKELKRLMDWMDQDPVYGAKARVFQRVGRPVSPDMERHRILIYSPILSGLYLFRMRTEVYDVSLAVANTWGSITYCGHLYNALSRSKLLDTRWQDMDVMITNLGQSQIWVGGERPNTLTDCFQKFCLQMGISASAFTHNRRHRTEIVSRAGPRGLGEGAPVSSMFKNQVCRKADMDWTTELVDDIIARSPFRMDGSIDNGDLTMTLIDDEEELRDKDRTRQQKAKARASGRDKTARTLVPEDLIKSLILSLNSESLEMSYPLLLMHRWCWKLLRQIKNVCDPVLVELFTPAYIEKENELPFVIGYILMAASGFDGGVVDSRLLKLAAAPINSMLGCGTGRIGIEVARKYGKAIEFGEEDSEDSD